MSVSYSKAPKDAHVDIRCQGLVRVSVEEWWELFQLNRRLVHRPGAMGRGAGGY